MRTDPQLKIRIPEELKKWLEEMAKENCRSQTAEVVYRLSEAKKQLEQAVA